MNTARARGTSTRRAAPGGRRATTAQGRFNGLAGRAATELERMRPTTHGRARRSRRESVIERVKHLV